MDVLALLSFIILAYLIGSIPFGLILTKISGLGDIRHIGSGNIGATNVLRTGNKKLAALTLILDAVKGAVPILIYLCFIPKTHAVFAITFGSAAILGHCFPIWLKFKGGKGVATSLGVLLAALPYAGLAAALTWLFMAFATRLSSLAALTAALIAPIVTFFIYGQIPAAICTIITLLVWIRHKDNIKRLIKGEETKIGSKKKAPQREPLSE